MITPLRGTDGNLDRFINVTRDLTQRRLNEQNLRQLLASEERFRLLVEQIRDYAIFIMDPKGRVISWNQGASRIKGYSAEEILGKHFSLFYIAEDLASGKPARELSIAVQEGRYEEEGWRVKKDGSQFWANVVITALWDKTGSLTGFAKVTRDLTQRKFEMEALRKKKDELENFAHTLSHDLRAPLRSISGYAQILVENHELADPDRSRYLQRISAAAGCMEKLIEDILTLSRVTSGDAAVEVLSLEQVVQEAISLVESEVESTGAEISVRKPLALMKANRTLLLQCFGNLFANALKFTSPGNRPRIEVFATYHENECEVHVKDHGSGIPAEYKESIFDIFERGAARSDKRGTGVGLAIVKRAVERMGGTVRVESEEGNGSDFIVRLPCEGFLQGERESAKF